MARDARTSRVDLYAEIRRDAKAGLSKRALQRGPHGVGYRTVAAALESAWPKKPKSPPKRGSRLDAYRDVIDGWLRDDLDAPRKQRHTAKRIFDRLLEEHDAARIVSYGLVRDYVATRRREIRIKAGREPANTFIPQTHCRCGPFQTSVSLCSRLSGICWAPQPRAIMRTLIADPGQSSR
ncbi:hypothetical protein [Nonomuraea sp. KM88]|uniref:hypothetical protein n=1 Tax=Nonomuraea sp. KM88 TaxID=3457427 RepID=UPI003FCD3480